MQRPINLILSATLMLTCASAVADGRPAGNPAVAAAGQGKWQTREWTKYPLITPMMGRGGDRAVAKLAVKNLQSAELEVFAAEGPDDRLRRQFPVTPEGTRIEAVMPKIGNYHWVSAREETEGKVTVASTAYFFGNPGAAPTALLLKQKYELEIVPQPLPREHGSYRESDKWQFLLRFNGQPLANNELKMETEFGTKTAFTSDAQGWVTVLFPLDFKPVDPAKTHDQHMGPRKGKFVLAVEHDEGGKHYLTAFNYAYSPDAITGKSLMAGAGFGVFGMLLAAPLLRRKKAANKNCAKEA
ncbi:hypothetical protein SCD_n02545 [Sulfuricella denitrificans skB26]|uniref:DUF4198 domain-containing protein n=1 Tax=Sulfuricella denitrificans (strain DSM 22764 / NBRC 105220 / skB26) TaxID=1163617 RepID=S6B7C8_SULDS|nr:hypothetical protein [Sulfuricella denitrificans]BAN36347.1 hypothetical protein SCD_n02545 [Sulfuricella denitrificans skB26]